LGAGKNDEIERIGAFIVRNKKSTSGNSSQMYFF
jgi:hypothetical protein